jgi:hypothetical protein
MKLPRLLVLLLAFSFACISPAIVTGCANTPTTQAAKYKTLATVGAAAQAAMDSTTALLKAGKITVPQFQKVATFYDTRFQPSFRFAVAAAQADLSTAASPDVTTLLANFLTLIAEVTAPVAK